MCILSDNFDATKTLIYFRDDAGFNEMVYINKIKKNNPKKLSAKGLMILPLLAEERIDLEDIIFADETKYIVKYVTRFFEIDNNAKKINISDYTGGPRDEADGYFGSRSTALKLMIGNFEISVFDLFRVSVSDLERISNSEPGSFTTVLNNLDLAPEGKKWILVVAKFDSPDQNVYQRALKIKIPKYDKDNYFQLPLMHEKSDIYSFNHKIYIENPNPELNKLIHIDRGLNCESEILLKGMRLDYLKELYNDPTQLRYTDSFSHDNSGAKFRYITIVGKSKKNFNLSLNPETPYVL